MATMDCKACLNKSNRAKLGAIALAATFTLLNLSFSGDHDGVADFGIELLRRRQLPSPRPSALADDDPEDYKELIVPKWLTAAVEYGQGEAPEQVEARLKAAMVVAVSESLRSNGSPPPELSQYTLEDLVAISQLYERDFGVVIYDPENDDFLLLYNRRATWVGDIPRLVYTFQLFVIMLRHDYPGRFRGRESEELAIAIGSGDYPHIRRECLLNFPHAVNSAPCNIDAKDRAPILQFSSVFRHTEILPHMLAMPMPLLHLPCFKVWATSKTVCKELSEDMVFGQEGSGLTSFENLTNQVVWRGTDFAYLNTIHHNALRKVHVKDIENKFEPEMGEDEKKTMALGVLSHLIEENILPPRWKGVALTIVAESDAPKAIEDGFPSEPSSSSLPWVNIKFSRPSPGDKNHEEFPKLADYGIQAIGESMSPQDLAQYKYHIDLGGGGGTTWTGTVQKLAMPGLLFHHVTPTKDYIHDWMTPWVHYVPVAGDLRDLRGKYEWAESHPQAAKLIAEQGTEFMRHLAAPERFDEMYQKVFFEPVRRVIEAYMPVSSSWRGVLRGLEGSSFKQVMQCSGFYFVYIAGITQQGCDIATMRDFNQRISIMKGQSEMVSSFRDI